MSKRQKIRRALHIKNFILICGLGFLLLVFLSGILPILDSGKDYELPGTLNLSFACLGNSRVKALMSWPHYDEYRGFYEVLYKENREPKWKHLVVTDSTLAALGELFSGRKYDFRVSFLGDSERSWAQVNGTSTPACNSS